MNDGCADNIPGLLRVVLLVAVILFSGFLCVGQANAYTTESPVVKEMVKKGVAFVRKACEGREDSFYRKLGGKCLVGLVMFKDGADVSDPLIQHAIDSCKQAAVGEAAKNRTTIYSIGIALIFLCEVSPDANAKEIQYFLDVLIARQKDHGGWGYLPSNPEFGLTGDTSMTQYAVLGLWEAHYAGFEVPRESVEKVCNWLLRTQDPSGQWGYQGKDPGVGKRERVAQKEMTHSLSAAGMSSVYVCADLLGMIDRVQSDRGLPSVLEKVKKPDNASGPTVKGVEPARLKKSFRDGNGWFSANLKVKDVDWVYYYMYALERYRSFRELADGGLVPEPDWYNMGVDYLKESQKSDGSWKNNTGGSAGKIIDTSFAVLFLLRSTQKTIRKTIPQNIAGVLTGGRGLPSNVSDIQIQGGRIVGKPLEGETDDLLSILEDETHPDYKYLLETSGNLKLSQQGSIRDEQKKRLFKLISGGTAEARAMALTTLARGRDLDCVPVLIESLRDDDVTVMLAARDGLRFISRKFLGFGLPDDPKETEIVGAVRRWKEWYRTIRPDAKFYD